MTAINANGMGPNAVLVQKTADDLVEGGVTQAYAMQVAQKLMDEGVDLLDVTTANLLPGYQVHFSAAVKSRVGVATATTGSVASSDLVEEIIGSGRADLVFMGHSLLRDPFWVLKAAQSAEIELDLHILARRDPLRGDIRSQTHSPRHHKRTVRL